MLFGTIYFDPSGTDHLILKFYFLQCTLLPTQLERKINVAGAPRNCTEWFVILLELVHAFPIFV